VADKKLTKEFHEILESYRSVDVSWGFATNNRTHHNKVM